MSDKLAKRGKSEVIDAEYEVVKKQPGRCNTSGSVSNGGLFDQICQFFNNNVECKVSYSTEDGVKGSVSVKDGGK